MENSSDPIILYILMRSGLDSLNAGKAVAQGCHAANQAVAEGRASDSNYLRMLLADWEGQSGRGFGITITLSVSYAEIKQIVAMAQMYGHHAGITHDPSYPLRDGETLHLIPLDTCAYVLGYKSVLTPFLDHLPLMP